MNGKAIIQEVTASIIAIVAVVGTFVITAYELVNGKPLSLPDYSGILIGAIVGAYFTNAASQNGARQAGQSAVQAAVAATKTNGTTTTTPPTS